jgi:glycosyltransferase involved in cell wall biosynthesis
VLVPQVFPANWWGWLYKRHHPESRLVWICHEPSAFIHSHAWIKALTPWWKRFLALLLRPALARIDMYLSRFCDAAIANSRFTADAMAAIYGFSPDRIASPGIDGAIYAAQETHQRKGIITVAHLSKFKRVDFLLDVFGELLTYHPELHYTIVGIGEEEDALKKKAVLLGIRSQVTFHGTADSRELVSLYRSSRLFLHGARNEPFGMAPLEAIASGTPVVAHQSGGIQEFITARCGRLVASSDPAVWGKQCAEYLDIILAQPDYHKDVRTCAGEFDWCRTLEPARDLIVREAQHGLPQKHKMVNL